MRLRHLTLWALRIPFVEAFRHSAQDRAHCDSVVVRVEDESGVAGYGEGAPRPYVTGETVDGMVGHISEVLWPAIADRALVDICVAEDLEGVGRLLPDVHSRAVLATNASRCAMELAVIDCVLRRQDQGLGQILPPRRNKVIYSGVISAGPLEKALQHARQMKAIGLGQVKVKVGFGDDIARVFELRAFLGPDVSIRLDANGAWSFDRACDVLKALEPCNVASIEQPLPRGALSDLKRLRAVSPIPIMVDESLVTIEDGESLAAAGAVDFFNIRLSKCGGMARALKLAHLARRHGIGIQIGSQVGETAILAAAGRHLAAHVEEVSFVEGSFGTLLLAEDITPDGIRFGHKGEAPLLGGKGLGIKILDERLLKYATKTVKVSAAAHHRT